MLQEKVFRFSGEVQLANLFHDEVERLLAQSVGIIHRYSQGDAVPEDEAATFLLMAKGTMADLPTSPAIEWWSAIGVLPDGTVSRYARRDGRFQLVLSILPPTDE